MKVGDLIIRDFDGMLAIVINIDRLYTDIVRVQYYAVPKEHEYGGWHCDELASSWRLQDESR